MILMYVLIGTQREKIKASYSKSRLLAGSTDTQVDLADHMILRYGCGVFGRENVPQKNHSRTAGRINENVVSEHRCLWLWRKDVFFLPERTINFSKSSSRGEKARMIHGAIHGRDIRMNSTFA